MQDFLLNMYVKEVFSIYIAKKKEKKKVFCFIIRVKAGIWMRSPWTICQLTWLTYVIVSLRLVA